MQVLDGKLVAQKLREELKGKTEGLVAQTKTQPGLAVVLVGDDPASAVYVRNKARACEDVGFRSWVHRMSADTSAKDLESLIESLNQSSEVHGILVQLPLPRHLDADEVLTWIDPKKDPDALTLENTALFFAGRARTRPCTPQGVMSILDHYGIEVAGLDCVVIGRSPIVGLPMAQMLVQANATVTTCHSRTRDLRAHTTRADLVVVAAGKPRFLGRDDFKQDSIVIDVGIHRVDGDRGPSRLCGDVRFEELEGWVRAATPVPGGVGPMTIASLLQNTYRLAQLHLEGEISDQ